MQAAEATGLCLGLTTAACIWSIHDSPSLEVLAGTEKGRPPFCQWWPGALGKVATHAVVYARLIIQGKDHGVHGTRLPDFLMWLLWMDVHTILSEGVL